MDEHTQPQHPEHDSHQDDESFRGAFQAGDDLIQELREAAGSLSSSDQKPSAPPAFTPTPQPDPVTSSPEYRPSDSTPQRLDLPYGGPAEIKMPSGPAPVRKAEFDTLSRTQPTPKAASGIDLLMNVKLPVSIELGRTQLPISKILELGTGSIVELDKLAGEPVDIVVNNITLARGEVVVLDEHFGVRITSLMSRGEGLETLGT